MSVPTTTSEQVSLETLLPTHIRLRRAHTFPPLESRHSYHETIHSQRDPVGASAMRRWFTLVKEYATTVGVAVSIIGVIVAIITVVVK